MKSKKEGKKLKKERRGPSIRLYKDLKKKHQSLLLEETSDHKAKLRIPKFEEKPSQYPDSLPSISSSGYIAVATSNIPVVKRVTWRDNSGGLTDVSIYPVSPTEKKRIHERLQRSRKPIGPETVFLNPLL